MKTRITKRHAAHLEQLERKGRITAEDVLADAKSPKSPLHELYDWDIKRSAESHWLDRTREIIRTIKVVIHNETTVIRFPRYVHDPDLKPSEQGYVSEAELRADKSLARRALSDECDRVVGSLTRARNLARGLNMEQAFEDLLARVVGLRAIVSAGLKTKAKAKLQLKRTA